MIASCSGLVPMGTKAACRLASASRALIRPCTAARSRSRPESSWSRLTLSPVLASSSALSWGRVVVRWKASQRAWASR